MEGYAAKPAGSCFYPADMTAAEFDALADPAKHSPYTLVQRDGDGTLKTVWYHDAYAESIDKIADYLKAAADITIKPSVREYLLKKIEGLRTDDYYASDKAWLEMTDSKMDLVIGPNEAVDDALYGTKASYGAYVLLKNLERTEELNALSARLPEFQEMLPGDPAHRAFVPGSESDIFSCNVLYCSGYTNAGFKVIAINFPYDAKVQEELGTRTILFDNVIREVKETVNGKGTVADALGNEALTVEKAKSNVLGAYLCAKEVEAHRISALIQKEDVLATFVANTIRSTRFGAADPTGVANIAVYNYLVESGAITRKASGRYGIDYGKTWQALETLGAEILRIQALGDLGAARSYAAKYGVVTPGIEADIVSLELEKIPVDIRFTYEK